MLKKVAVESYFIEDSSSCFKPYALFFSCVVLQEFFVGHLGEGMTEKVLSVGKTYGRSLPVLAWGDRPAFSCRTRFAIGFTGAGLLLASTTGEMPTSVIGPAVNAPVHFSQYGLLSRILASSNYVERKACGAVGSFFLNHFFALIAKITPSLDFRLSPSRSNSTLANDS